MYERMSPGFLPGDLAYISDNFRWLSMQDGVVHLGKKRLYERINRENFPSTNDYVGDSTIVSVGDPVLILSVESRVIGSISLDLYHKIKNIPLGELEIDVYTVLANGVPRKSFRIWLAHSPLRQKQLNLSKKN